MKDILPNDGQGIKHSARSGGEKMTMRTNGDRNSPDLSGCLYYTVSIKHKPSPWGNNHTRNGFIMTDSRERPASF